MKKTAQPSRLTAAWGHSPCRTQSGTVLAITLVFLLVTTIVGVTAITLSTFDERIAGNLRDRNNAFASAELALRYGEALVDQQTDALRAEFKTAPIRRDRDDIDYFANEWDSASQMDSTRTGNIKTDLQDDEDFPLMAEPPIFVIEEGGGRGLVPGNAFAWNKSLTAYYTVTSRGHGVTSPAVVVLQSVVLRMDAQ